jgi:peptidyl-prolyl cis-trans isomerase NIMA-interacting 1
MYQALHILVKHKDVRNPKSWKEPVVTRTEDEALAMIEGFHANLVTGDPETLQQRFSDLATSESHCSSAKRGGDLGQFGCSLYLYISSAAPSCFVDSGSLML